MKKSHKHFNEGDIVYWCGSYGNGRYDVKWGRVDEQFSDAVYVDFLELREHRTVNGIPLDEWKEDTYYHKLPKNWTYNTQLYELEWQNIEDFSEYKAFVEEAAKQGIIVDKDTFTFSFVSNPKLLKIAYSVGLLVKSSTIFHGRIDEEITKEGYRIIKKY